ACTGSRCAHLATKLDTSPAIDGYRVGCRNVHQFRVHIGIDFDPPHPVFLVELFFECLLDDRALPLELTRLQVSPGPPAEPHIADVIGGGLAKIEFYGLDGRT